MHRKKDFLYLFEIYTRVFKKCTNYREVRNDEIMLNKAAKRFEMPKSNPSLKIRNFKPEERRVD